MRAVIAFLTLTLASLLASADALFVTVAGTTPGPGDDNPDGWAAYSTLYVSKDYEAETGTDCDTASHDVCVDNCTAASWGAAYGYNSTGGWRFSPAHTAGPNNCSAGEDNGGWKINESTPAVDETDIYVISYMLYLTDALLDRICADGFFWGSGNKIVDIKQWNAAGSGEDDPSRIINTFQYLSGKSHPTDTPDDRAVFTHEDAGASTDFSNGGVSQVAPKDWCALGDQWVWIAHVFSIGDKVSSYFKFPSDSGVTLMLQRTWSQQSRTGSSYADTDVDPSRGWFGPTFGASPLWGYWDDIDVTDPASFVTLDIVRVADGWVNPPF